MKRHKMVGWYDPVQLWNTAREVVVSTLLGRHVDKRVLEALADSGGLRPLCFYEVCGQGGDDFWFDYISDVGDGFDSTYTMAYHITRRDLDLKAYKSVVTHKTQRGKLLVFGGDEVYPTASWTAYQERFVELYDSVFPKKTTAQKKSDVNVALPAVFAVPGNHDWYDSLVAFSSLLCREKEFCGWQCAQNRSYFAIRLPRGWWLFGTDMQLGSSLDEAQMYYFEQVVKKHVAPGDRIILCNAEPHWIPAAIYPEDRAFNNRSMGYFEGHILNHQTAIYVAGDRHYYRRHEEVSNRGEAVDPESKSKMQKIVAGGGGAFLHPTHGEKVETVGRDHLYQLRKSFPDPSRSWWLTCWNVLFLVWNWKFGLVTAALYLLTAQAVLADLGQFSFSNIPEAIRLASLAVFTKPVALFWVLLIIIGFIFFTETHSRVYRWIAGPIHATSHLFAVLIIGWYSAFLVGGGKPISAFSVAEIVVVALPIAALGFVVGPTLMGLYLLISLNVFGRHHNEAFSALKIADYKNFLRFKIADNGDLTIFPVGVRKAQKQWVAGDKSGPELIPENEGPDNKPFLIEDPIVFEKPVPDSTRSSETAKELETGTPMLIRAIPVEKNGTC